MCELQRCLPEERTINLDGVLSFMNCFEKLDGHSFMVLRHGEVVAEGWRNPYKKEYLHTLFSGTKSFTAIAVGLAIQEGLLNLDDYVISFFPEKLTNPPCENMRKMQVKHLLSMTTGHIAEDPEVWGGTEDWIKDFLRSYITHEPGSRFVYNSGASNMLSAIVSRVCGITMEEYLKVKFLMPLGIETYSWDKLYDGTSGGGYGLSLCTEDYAKLGQFLLQKGKWNGKQILSADYVEKLFSTQVDTADDPWNTPDRRSGYGYHFWKCRIPNAIRADGSKGQFCLVLLDYDAVVVTTAAHQNLYEILDAIWEHIVPAMCDNVKMDTILEQEYRKRIAEWSIRPIESEPYGKNELLYSEKIYNVVPNKLDIKSFSFVFQKDVDVLKIKGASDEIEYELKIGKNGKWIENNSFSQKIGCIAGLYPVKNPSLKEVACSGGWIGENTYVITVEYTRASFEDVYVFEFYPEVAKLQYKRNVVEAGVATDGNNNCTVVQILGSLK